jgi:hypothetical protein
MATQQDLAWKYPWFPRAGERFGVRKVDHEHAAEGIHTCLR